MIKVKVKRLSRDNKFITSYQVTGHAFYDEPGKDIVCSAVSAITVGTVNSIEALTGVVPQVKMQSGMLKVIIPSDLSSSVAEQVQLLLESMVVMLNSIEESYGEHIQVTTTY
ncbi:ribosomal-processing cysteine protease Prp [Paenibacillus albiflavus]|uniref:Ribosomal processing cysteine protease Prp n=1 Tax=Paenibacillus albiflavus TaxID=2545760 RepID=A0A4R4E6L6_9BACL|nr:ribosomal-processing cysteine protease Prp [Paenibacillus albiflavus]TCZ75149.1 ribosomal-processing cysteine protease Prp [Paenibacillus albiflavus]